MGKVDNEYNGVIKHTLKYQKLGWKYQSFESIISTILNILMIVIIVNMILEGRLTIGEYTIILSYYATIISSVKYFFNLGQSLQETKVSYNRIDNIIRLKEQKNGKNKLETIDEIDLNKVDFGYGEKNIWLFYNKT